MRLFFTLLALVLAAGPLRAQALVPHEYTVRFSISTPADWEVLRDVDGLRMVARSPRTGPSDLFREDVTVALESVSPMVSLAQYSGEQVAGLERALLAFSVVESDDRTVGGHPAKRLVYAYIQNERLISGIAYSFVADGRAYVLTGTALTETFDEYLPVFEQIAGSFRL